MGVNSRHSRLYKTVKDKGYVKLSQKRLVPTETGIRLCDFLTAHFADVLAYDYTARLEDQLDEIASGQTTRLQVLRAFWQGFHPQLNQAAEYALSQVKARTQTRTPKPLKLHLVED